MKRSVNVLFSFQLVQQCLADDHLALDGREVQGSREYKFFAQLSIPGEIGKHLRRCIISEALNKNVRRALNGTSE